MFEVPAPVVAAARAAVGFATAPIGRALAWYSDLSGWRFAAAIAGTVFAIYLLDDIVNR